MARATHGFGMAAGLAVGGLLAMSVIAAQYDPLLQYQRRGDRAEGLRLIPVGGYDIELLSARIDNVSQQSVATAVPRVWGDTLRARFYLPENASVNLTVRQIRSRSTYYWLTYPEPVDKPTVWKAGAVNEYPWPTETVLRRPELRSVGLDDLGAVVRAGGKGPARVERVLPVDLTDGEPLASASRYRFSLKTNGRAKVSADVYHKDRKLFSRPSNWEQGGSPITIVWEAGPRDTEDWYRLVLSGYFENNAALDKVVEFYHRPTLNTGRGSR